MAVAVVSAGLLLTLVAGGFGSYVEAAGTEQNTGRTERSERRDTPTDHQSTPVVRPHPRGLPRRGANVRRDRQVGSRRTRGKNTMEFPQARGMSHGVSAT